ncbi:DUF4405 domain-containing protein [Paenirhodobacter sp.]|uniref:DUF4405 domain-containing protein n=1 Tax=Paenirhodobacter sp. TaxID=1965326 RepID=UPI003B5051D2
MKAFLLRYATPLITGLFLVSLISGVALFFHIGSVAFHGMHEWLSMVLILPFGLHLWKNWRPMTAYFRRPPMAAALAVSVLAAVLFVLPTLGGSAGAGGRPPQFAVAQKLLNASVHDVAPAMGMQTDALIAQLRAAGMPVATETQTLAQVAEAAGLAPTAALTALAGQ